jgi:hypothetical protein
VLRVDRHDGGDVDWWTVDAARPLTVTPERTEHRALPGRFRYPGAPLPRFWQIEDGHVDIGGFPPDRAHFATLLLIDLIASHSDDWFTFPFLTRAGYVLRMHEVRVTDSFGDTWPAAGKAWEPMPPDEWSLFRVRGLDGRPPRAPRSASRRSSCGRQRQRRSVAPRSRKSCSASTRTRICCGRWSSA